MDIKRFTNLNLATCPLDCGIDPPAHLPEVKTIDVKGRHEHEAFIRDADKCKEYGVDQAYETMVYLKRWGGWIAKEKGRIITVELEITDPEKASWIWDNHAGKETSNGVYVHVIQEGKIPEDCDG